MTTTVLRGKTGALLRIPTGALRRSPAQRPPQIGDPIIAFINESTAYYNSAFPPDYIDNVRGRELWLLHAEAFTLAYNALLDDNFVVPVQVQHIIDSAESAAIKPPGEEYPEPLIINSVLKFPSTARFTAEVTTNGEFVPSMFLLDRSGSMYEPDGYLLEPGLPGYLADPPGGRPPGVVSYYDLKPHVEEWLYWITSYLPVPSLPP